MAESGVDLTNCVAGGAPCRRFFVPTAVGLLPVDTQTGFMLVTFLSYTLAGVFLFLILREWGFPKVHSLVGLLFFFTLGPAVKFNAFDFWLVDPAALLTVAVVTWAILTDRDALFVAALAVGITVKENLILLAPLYYTLNADGVIDRQTLKKTFLYTLPALLTFLVVFFVPLLIEPASRPGRESRLDAVLYLARNPTDLSKFLVAYGLISVLPLFDIVGNRRAAARFGPFILLVAAQYLYAPFATSRFMMIAYVPAIILAMTGLERVTADVNSILDPVRIRIWYWAPVPLFLILYTPFAGYSYMYIIQLKLQVTLFALALLGLAIAGLVFRNLRYSSLQTD